MTFAQAAGGLVFLYFGGEMLVRGASALAARLGVSALAIGLTVVAFGTSAPELVVSIDAALSGSSDIALGNVVGSNIANIALILGLAALLRPAEVHAKIVRLDGPVMIVVSLALLGAMADGRASRLEGGLLFAGLVAYVAFTLWEARREPAEVKTEFASAAPHSTSSAARSGVLVVTGCLALVGGGHLLVTSAVALATAFGVSQATIGLTIVAVGTSLPELAASAIAAVRGQGDIAVGNVVGSNIFNILGILGVAALIRPLPMGDIRWADLGVMLALAAVLAALVYARPVIGRAAGLSLIAAYVLYTAWLVAG